MRRERIARGEGGNQFKKVKPRRVGMEGRREEGGDANKSSLHGRGHMSLLHSWEKWLGGERRGVEAGSAIYPYIPLHTWPRSRFVQW